MRFNLRQICLISTVSGAANGGTAAYVRSLGEELVRAGHRVRGVNRLLTANEMGLQYTASDAPANGIHATIPFAGWESRLIRPAKAFRPLLRLLPHLMSRPGIDHFAHRLFQLAYLDNVIREVPADTDVIHYVGNGWELLGYPALEAARRRRAIFTVTPFVHPNQWGDSSIDVRLYNCAHAVFVCSDFEREHLMQKGVSPGRLRLISMAPVGATTGDAERFRRRHRLGQRPLILFLARKQQYKGYHALLQSMTVVVAAVPDVCLVVAGADVEPPFPSVPSGHLLDLGELKPVPEDVAHKADALAACDVFCMPSLAEAFGLVYVEAWSYGKPVIGGMAPALQELIIDGINGYRVTHDDKQIAGRLIELLHDSALREQLGAEGRRIQQEKYTWDAVLGQHLQIWDELEQSGINVQ